MPIKLSKIKPNPSNPRVIRDENFKKLTSSIDKLFKGLYLRPIAITEDNVIIGGNQRYRALQELGYKEIPDECVVVAKGWTQEEIDRFIIADNSTSGEWDWDELANSWDDALLTEYNITPYKGSDAPIDDFFNEGEDEEKLNSNKIVLEYTDEEFVLVNEAFAKLGGSKEKIVFNLLGL